MKKVWTKGFSLAEILVVIGVISVVGIIITDVFLSSLRGSNKAAIIDNIKRNGQTSLDTMDKNIRNADSIVCPIPVSGSTVTSDYIVVRAQDGTYIRYEFIK